MACEPDTFPKKSFYFPRVAGYFLSSGKAVVKVCCWHQDRSESTFVFPRFLSSS